MCFDVYVRSVKTMIKLDGERPYFLQNKCIKQAKKSLFSSDLNDSLQRERQFVFFQRIGEKISFVG